MRSLSWKLKSFHRIVSGLWFIRSKIGAIIFFLLVFSCCLERPRLFSPLSFAGAFPSARSTFPSPFRCSLVLLTSQLPEGIFLTSLLKWQLLFLNFYCIIFFHIFMCIIFLRCLLLLEMIFLFAYLLIIHDPKCSRVSAPESRDRDPLVNYVILVPRTVPGTREGANKYLLKE